MSGSKPILIISFFFFNAHLWSQTSVFNNLVVKQLDQTLGLSETSNAFFEEDNRNNLWISSIDGLNRFDGISTTVYRPSLNANGYKFSSIVSSRVFIDNDKNYWYSTNDGIHRRCCMNLG